MANKFWRGFLAAMVYMLTVTSYAFAVDTTLTYHSSFLVLMFLGLFAAIVVAQALPAMIMFYGMMKSMFYAKEREAEQVKN